ncbi:hypothetical protein [Pseudobacillus wudalianchiensis]|uniref:DUF4352 domain-containing protein n=1 Tax=Pseudobacillus wudalianchiensis TaxID=1743143 RepID=A0A1B9B948_9BACI|nr:hypothetical protein [Bacillus wudalianchiensis]OCA92609.1 hypothetical protein A8F95_02630 [Bacillus wudalianchiensis]
MKRFIVLLTLISVIAILTACSSEPSLKLTNKKVDIINDKGKTGAMILQQGEKAGKEVVPTTLYYTFTIKNEGSKKLGDTTNLFTVKIQPNEKLLTVSKEVMGFNIFNPKEYDNSGLGYGSSYVGILEPNTEGQFILHYDLGVDEETTEALLVPSKQQLEKLRNHALEATLIVLLDNEEIARFDLNKKE